MPYGYGLLAQALLDTGTAPYICTCKDEGIRTSDIKTWNDTEKISMVPPDSHSKSEWQAQSVKLIPCLIPLPYTSTTLCLDYSRLVTPSSV